jgi:NitT/TauT family transport system substrate-binding protein
VIVAKEYKIDLDVAKSAVRNLVTSTTKGVPYWGEGEIHMDGLKRMIEAQRSVGRSPAKSTTARSSTRGFCPTI